MDDLGNCECGSPLASGGVVGVYCTNRRCPVQAAMIRQLAHSFDRLHASMSNDRLQALQMSIREQMGNLASGPLVVNVSGGRKYDDVSCINAALDFIHKEWGISLLIHGGATGADTHSGEWAYENEVNCLRIPAKWESPLRKRAGFARNREMAKWQPHVWVFFRGGNGTAHAREVAREHQIRQIEIENEAAQA